MGKDFRRWPKPQRRSLSPRRHRSTVAFGGSVGTVRFAALPTALSLELLLISSIVSVYLVHIPLRLPICRRDQSSARIQAVRRSFATKIRYAPNDRRRERQLRTVDVRGVPARHPADTEVVADPNKIDFLAYGPSSRAGVGES